MIKINYKNFIEFIIKNKLNRKQVYWVETLVEYYFKIKYIKSNNNIRANILS